MDLPKVGSSRVAKEGVSTIDGVVSRPPERGGLGFVFRPLPDPDYGVDGLIEVVNFETEEATGKLVGVQVKAGTSYFQHSTDDGWVLYIKKATVHYWREYSVPVVLTVVDTSTGRVFWSLGSDEDFEETEKYYKVPVPESQAFDSTCVEAIRHLATRPSPELAAQVDALSEEVSLLTAQQLERYREMWREGDRSAVRQWLDDLMSSPARLKAVKPTVAASVLRYAAGVCLDDEGALEDAETLMQEARRLDPESDDLRLRGVLLLRRGDPQGAVELLADSPSPNAQILRAAILRSVGDRTMATEVLNATTPSRDTDLADAWRLRALLSLEEGDPESAAEAIGKAETHGPRDSRVRLAKAKLTFYRALLPQAVPESVPLWPQPVPEELIRRDGEARRRFRKAAERFGELLELDWHTTEREFLEAWKLAALTLNPESRGEATAFAESVLSRTGRQPFVLFWAAVADLPLDLDEALDDYEMEIDPGEDIQEALLVAATLFAVDRHDQLADWLEGSRLRFAEGGAEDAWLVWRARTFIAEGRLESAREMFEEIPDDETVRTMQTELLMEAARKSGNSDELIAFLERSWKKTGEHRWLLEVCQQYARAGQWELVAPHVATLLNVYPTYRVRRLGIFARYQTGDFAGSMELVNQTLQDVGEGSERSELLRIRGDIRLRSGSLAGAIDDLKAVVAASEPQPATRDLLALARARYFAGHVHELASIARRVRTRDDLDASASLMLSGILAHDARALAREFWHRARNEGIDDEGVTTALALGYSLGLEEHLSDLTARLMGLAEAGDPRVQRLTLDELITRHRDWEGRRERVLELYQRGETATHLIADFLGVPLVKLYHVLPTANEAGSTLRHTFPLQLRAGGRGLPATSGEVARPGRLALDLSALLLAEHLEILPEMEDAFAPLRIPHLTIVALRDQKDRLRHHQPKRVETSRRLLRAEREGRVDTWQGELPSLSPEERKAARHWWQWVALLERAQRENAFVLDLPLTAESEHGRPTDVAGPSRLARVVTVSEVCGFLVANGLVDPAQLQTELEGPARFGSMSERESKGDERTGVDENGTRLYQDAVIYMTRGGADALETTGALKAASQYFQLLVDPSDQDVRRVQVDALSEIEEHVEWLDGLIRRVSDGLSDGRYALLPDRERFSVSQQQPDDIPRSESVAVEVGGGARAEQEVEKGGMDGPEQSEDGADEDDREDFGEPHSLALLCLSDVVSLPPDLVDIVWIADRWINRHAFAGSTRVTDVLELVAAMEESGHVTPARRLRIHHQLRSANIRIIPLSAEEVVQQLGQARVIDGDLRETAGLRTLRQYAAGVAGDAGNLRMPSPDDSAIGEWSELEVLRSYIAAIREALVQVWAEARDSGDAASRAEAEARSRWIIRNLYVSAGLLRVRAHAPGLGAEDRVNAAEAASLLASAVQLLSTDEILEGGDTVAAAYVEWIYEAVIESRADRDPKFRNTLVEHLRDLLADWSEASSDDPMTRAVGLTLAGRVFDALPPPLRDLLSEDATFMERIGRQTVSALTIGQWEIDIRDFAEAGAEALRQRFSEQPSNELNPVVSVLDSEPPTSLTVTAEGSDALELTSETEDQPIRLRDVMVGILHPDESTRRDAARAVRREADWSVTEWEAEVERILALPDHASRFEALTVHRTRSVQRHYSDLVERWKAQGRISQRDLGPPPSEELVRHLRLNPTSAGRGDPPSSEPSGSTQSRLDRAAQLLIAEEGLEAAFDRLAGLPVPLPTVLLEGVADLNPGAQEEFVRHLLQKPLSPIGVVQAVRIIAWLGRMEPRYLRLARFWIVRVLRRAVEEEVELLLLLVSEAHRRMRHETNLAELPGTTPEVPESRIGSPDALLAAWTHGHRLITALRSLGGDPTSLLAWARYQVDSGTEHLFSPGRQSYREYADPKAVRLPCFVVGALQYVSQDVGLWEGRGFPSNLESLLTRGEGETILPHPDLLRDLGNASDQLGTWLQLERQPDDSILVDSVVVVPSRYTPDTLLNEALEGLRTDATKPGPWLTLELVLGERRLTGAEAERFENALAGYELPTMLPELGDAAVLAIIRLARQARYSDHPATPGQLRESLLALGQENLTQEGARTEVSELRGAVIEALYLLSQSEDSPADAMSVFAEDLQELGRSEPAYLHQIRDLLESLVLSRPVEEAAELLGLWLESRGV